MPAQEVLILAMTRMLSGVCTAGLTTEPDPASRLRWVRPVKEHDSLLLGDLILRQAQDGTLRQAQDAALRQAQDKALRQAQDAALRQAQDAALRQAQDAALRQAQDAALRQAQDAAGVEERVIQLCDVVELNLKTPRPDPPHAEDWITDFIYHRPCLLRRLEGERRADFLANYLDRAPQEVLGRNPTRSLCLIRPDRLWCCFTLDPYSLKYQARIGFTLTGVRHARANSPWGVPVTDIKWRALGRSWLGERGGELALDEDTLRGRLQAEKLYLALGLSRGYEGQIWLMVIGVHVVPDYRVEIDYGNL
jgi:hypothetical protein